MWKDGRMSGMIIQRNCMSRASIICHLQVESLRLGRLWLPEATYTIAEWLVPRVYVPGSLSVSLPLQPTFGDRTWRQLAVDI